MNALSIWHIAQVVFISIELVMFLIYGYFIFEIKRAERMSQINVPLLWVHVMIGNVVFILASIICIALLRV